MAPTDSSPPLVPFNGHMVDPARLDEFVSGRTGQPITDAEWDETKRRLESDQTHLVPEHLRGA